MMNRRSALLGVAAAAWGCARSRVSDPSAGVACVLTPEQEEGPYFLQDAQLRGDLREDRAGVPLTLALTVVDARTCRPIPAAAVDVWHCDGAGLYSGFTAESARPMPMGRPPPFPPGPPDGRGRRGPPPRPPRTDALAFLRGVQLTDAAGEARFTTIYPGWYPGRAVHIHLKVRTGGALLGQTYGGGHVVHTGQLYLPEDVSDEVFTRPTYASHAGSRVRQSGDGIFQGAGRSGLVGLTSVERGSGARGYSAVATIAVAAT